MKSSTETLISALRILAEDIQSDDGVVNQCILEAADRLEELNIKRQPLSDEEIEVIVSQLPSEVAIETAVELARIVEKAHGVEEK